MTNRYPQLTALMPKGSFWDGQGETLPFLSNGYDFRFVGTATREYGVFDNDRHLHNVTTDSDGVVILNLKIDPGEHEIKLTDIVDNSSLRAYVTIKNWAVWHAAYAEVFEELDTGIEAILEGSHIEEANATHLNDVFGRQLRLSHELGHSTESYRNALQQLRQAYRLWSGRKLGIIQTPSALTNSAPLIVPSEWRPTWILGHQLVPNGDFEKSVRTTVSPTTNTGITINSISDNNVIDDHALVIHANDDVSWAQGPVLASADIAPGGQYTLAAGLGHRACIISPNAETYTLEGMLRIQIGASIGLLDLDGLTTASAVNAVINAAFPNTPADVVLSYIPGSNPSTTLTKTVESVRIKCPSAYAVEKVAIHPHPYKDAAIGLGFCPSRTTCTASGGSDTLTLSSGTTIPDVVEGEGSLAVRIGRGFNQGATENINLTQWPTYPNGAPNASSADYSIMVADAATSLDLSGMNVVGGKLEIANPLNYANIAVYDIIAHTDTTIIVRTTGLIYGNGVRPWAVYEPGETATIKSKTGTSVTLSQDLQYDHGDPIAPPAIELLHELPKVQLPKPPATIDVTMPDPLVAGAQTDTITVAGNNYSDGWSFNVATPISNGWGPYYLDAGITITDAADTIDNPQLAENRRIALGTLGVAVEFSRIIPGMEAYRGRTIHVSFLVQWHCSAPGGGFRIGVDYGNGTSAVYGSQSTSRLTPIELYDPVLKAEEFVIPWDAASATPMTVILEIQTTSFGKASIAGASARIIGATGNLLGSGTVPRSPQRATFGELLYVWGPDKITDTERGVLALPERGVLTQPTKKGHIDYASNAHGVWERFDVSEYAPINIRGAYTELQWTEAGASLTNMELNVGTPGRLSWLSPTKASTVSGEALALYGSDKADLAFTSDQNQENARLYGDSIPRLPSNWSFDDEDTVDIALATASVAAGAWTLDYQRLTEAQTDVIDTLTTVAATYFSDDNTDITITVGAHDMRVGQIVSFATVTSAHDFSSKAITAVTATTIKVNSNSGTIGALTEAGTVTVDSTYYRWFVDLAMYQRVEAVEKTRLVTRQIQFDATKTAFLPLRTDLDRTVSILTADNGTTMTIVPTSEWRYKNSQEVSIEHNTFDGDSIYTLTYNSRVATHTPPTNVVIEWRAHANAATLLTESWVTVDRDQIVDWTKRYHQLRVRISGITDTRDLRIHGLGLRGLDLTTAPGLGI